jgi:hypothetical protein
LNGEKKRNTRATVPKQLGQDRALQTERKKKKEAQERKSGENY